MVVILQTDSELIVRFMKRRNESVRKIYRIVQGDYSIDPTVSVAIIEMVKNIYDHATSPGYLHLLKVGNNFYFTVFEEDGDAVNLEKPWIKKNTFNTGVGIKICIKGVATPGYHVDINTDNGVTYSGQWMP